ncbi:MAG TPA: S8 family serine peptidase [Gaiellaceae bacterium]|nr:S8 family serine peptidase [Gaiellaceae bacterium]
MRRLLVAVGLAAAVAVPAAVAAGAQQPNDPFLARQWYVSRDHALDTFDTAKQLPTVRVAVIDSGVDAGHSELKDRIVASKSFVGGSAKTDTFGHGTFVAGEIAAIADNGAGIVGLAPPARLLVAKVVRDDGSIPPKAEAAAIRWAVRMRARVINLSLGSTRDPGDPSVDGYSAVEKQAIEFAVRRGVLVVAAVGNGDDAPTKPWPYASYPAAFPHVLGVAAYGRSGNVPTFSNRDKQYVDLAAPGMDIFSLFPRNLTQRFASCSEQGYSSCGTTDFRHADGTSFASPQVAAAAALLFGEVPSLRPDQASAILKQTADDATPASGCADCTNGPDPLSGYGRLDFERALDSLGRSQLPVPDRLEPNDDAGAEAAIVATPRAFTATLDAYDDPNDVYKVHLDKGQRLSVVVRASTIDPSLILWKRKLTSLAGATSDLRARRSIHPQGVPEHVRYRAAKAGWYYVQVKLAPASSSSGAYRIKLSF